MSHLPHFPLPAPSLIVFDLDGTLVDSGPATFRAVNALRASMGLTRVAPARVLSWMGGSTMEFLSRAVGEAGPELVDLLPRWRRALSAESASVRAYPGTIDMLQMARKRGIRLAVLSNKVSDLARLTLDLAGLSPWFKNVDVLGPDLVGVAKPDPAGLSRLMRAHRAEPTRVWMVGDSDVDMLAARSAGCVAVACAWGWGDAAGTDADMCLPDPTDLMHVLRDMATGQARAG